MSLINKAATGGNLGPAPTPALLILPQRRLPLALALMKLYNDFTELPVRKLLGQGHNVLWRRSSRDHERPPQSPPRGGPDGCACPLAPWTPFLAANLDRLRTIPAPARTPAHRTCHQKPTGSGTDAPSHLGETVTPPPAQSRSRRLPPQDRRPAGALHERSGLVVQPRPETIPCGAQQPHRPFVYEVDIPITSSLPYCRKVGHESRLPH